MTASTLRVESHIAARAKKLHAFLWFVVEIRPIGSSCKQVFVFIDSTTRAAYVAELGDEKGPHAPLFELYFSDDINTVSFLDEGLLRFYLAEQKASAKNFKAVATACTQH